MCINVSNPSAVNTILGPDGITYDAVTENPIYEDLDAQAAATDVITQEDIQDDKNVLQKLGLPEDFDLKKAGIELGVNYMVGAPISLIARAIRALPPSASQLAYDAYTPTQQSIIDQEFGLGGVMEGYNAVSAFGKGALETVQDRLEERTSNGIFDATTDKLNDLVEKLGGTPIDAPAYENEVAIDDDSDGPSVDTGPVGPQFEDPGYADPGVDAEENQPDSTETDDDFADDFDDGTMTGEAADSMDDVLGPMPEETNIVDEVALTGGEGTGDGGGGSVEGTGTDAAKDTSQGETGYGSCFIAGTKVTMADGTLKNIQEVVAGDKVKGHKEDNTVLKLDPTLLGDRKLYSFNDNNHYFFTSEHPFMTEEGWKSVKPEKTKERDGVELYEQLKGELKIGDKLVTDKGLIEITSINSKEMNNPEMPLYNFNVSNDNSYIADGYVVHNKGGSGNGGGGCVIATHAVNSGAFTKDTKREAIRWCVKNLHRTWWGEAVRKGYKYYGQKAIEQGKAKNHYQEFKDYVAFGTGKRRTLKTGWTFVHRTVQFFLKGLTL